MTIDQMRGKIEKVYNAPRWIARVQQMPPSQVVAIYNKFLETGKFDNPRKLRRGKKRYEQMTVFDFMEKENQNG